MKPLFLAAMAVFAFAACGEKDCETYQYGELCFRSKTNKSRVDVYLDGKKKFTLDTMEERCIDTITAGNYTYTLNYVKIAGGAGNVSEKTIFVPYCEKVVVQMIE